MSDPITPVLKPFMLIFAIYRNTTDSDEDEDPEGLRPQSGGFTAFCMAKDKLDAKKQFIADITARGDNESAPYGPAADRVAYHQWTYRNSIEDRIYELPSNGRVKAFLHAPHAISPTLYS